MPRYADDARERVREAVDMVDLVGQRTELRRAGSNRYEGLCPFHDERTPSFGINPVEKLYHCFGCQAGGDVFKFVMETEGLDFPAALESLAGRYGVELEVVDEDPAAAERRARRDRLLALLARSADYYVRVLWESDEAAGAREYLLGRGIEEQTLREFRVGYAPSAWDRVMGASRRAGFSHEEMYAAGVVLRSRSTGRLMDRFRRRIMFPLTDARGRVRGFGGRALGTDQRPKYLNSAENEVFHKGSQLFALDLARPHAAKAGAVLLAEGYTDVVMLHQVGLRNSVGIMGTALTEEQVAELARLAGAQGRLELALDADSAGQGAMLRAARLVAGRNLQLRVVPMEAGADPADVVAAEGGEAMRARVARSVPFVSFHVERILDAADVGSAEGRDRALEELGEVLGPLAPSATREELVRLAASRLGLSEGLVAEIAGAGAPPSPAAGAARGGGAPSGSDPPAGRGTPSRARAVLDRRERTERNFLALCIAHPAEGAAALTEIDPERHLTSPLVRRAALRLRSSLAAPLEGVADEDESLHALLADLVLRSEAEPGEPVALEVERLQLELARLDREMAAAQAAGSMHVAALATERGQVRDALQAAMGKATEGAGGR